MTIHDDFAFFALDINATMNQIKTAYRAHAFNLHPDQGGDVAQFAALNERYNNCLEFARNAPCALCNGTGIFTTISAAMIVVKMPCALCNGTGRAHR
jgi:DnaJ-class molecular chaperone